MAFFASKDYGIFFFEELALFEFCASNIFLALKAGESGLLSCSARLFILYSSFWVTVFAVDWVNPPESRLFCSLISKMAEVLPESGNFS